MSWSLNIRFLYGFHFFHWFLVLIAVKIPYLQSVGLDMHKIMLLISVHALFMVLLEVPSGYLADMWGRKNTVITGAFFLALSGFLYIYADMFWEFVLIYTLLAIAGSLISGSDIALLYDSIRARDRGELGAANKVLGNFMFCATFSECLAAFAASSLVAISFRHVLWVQFGASALAFVFALFLKEAPYPKMAQNTHKENFRLVFREMFQKNALLTLIIVNFILWALATYVSVWLHQKNWQLQDIPIKYFGYIWGVYHLVLALMNKQVVNIEKFIGSKKVLLIISVLPIVGFFGMAYLSSWWGVLAGLSFMLSRAFNSVILKDAVNTRIKSDYRATANSIMSLGVRLVFVLIGPLIGWGIDHIGLQSILAILGALFAVLFLALMPPLLKKV